MKDQDKREFVGLLGDVMAFYRQDVSDFAVSVWWQACASFDIEQVRKALTRHAMDPERGQFAPKPADIVRQLQGTNTDRALVAWGKAYDAMQRVGAYQSVAFDDPAIHAAIDDMGGWPAVCRLPTAELSHTQRRFCELHRAYTGRGEFPYPPKLAGQHELDNLAAGQRIAKPLLIGNAERAMQVLANGRAGPRQDVTALPMAAALRLVGGAQ